MRTIVFGLAVWLWVTMPVSAQEARPADGIPLEQLVTELKVALLQVAEASEAQNLPALESVVLEAKTSIKTEANGRISLWVVELGGRVSGEFASTVTVTLKPPPPGSPSDIAAFRLSDALREGILAGARAIGAAKKGNPPLVADKLTATVNFALARSGDGKVTVQFPPFGGSAGGGVSAQQIQTMTVTYKR